MTHSAPAAIDTYWPEAQQAEARPPWCEESARWLSPPEGEGEDWLSPVLEACSLTGASLEELARETGALRRCRVIREARQLLTLLMLYVVSDASLRDVAAYSAQRGAPLSDEALRQRFHQAEPFVSRLLALLFGAQLLLPEARRVLLIDGTTVQAPAAKGATFRLHTQMALGSSGCAQVELTTSQTGESLTHFDLHRGDIVLADSEFCCAKDIQALVERGVDVLARFCNHRWPGQPALCWQDALKAMPPGSLRTFPTTLPNGLPVFVHVLALPEEQANEARRKKRKSWKKRTGKLPQDITLLLAGYVLLLTSLPPSLLSAQQALSWYRRRWQIELLFKRQKSLLGMSELNSGCNSALSRVRIWMKLLYSFLVEHGARWETPLSDKRDKSVWRAWRLAREVLRAKLWLPLLRWRQADVLVFNALAERPRKRRTQTLNGLLQALQEPLIA